MKYRLRSLLLCVALLPSAWLQAQAPTSKGKEVPFTPPHKWAMIIGANDYTELGKLSYASGDATSFAKALEDRFGFQPEAVQLITDSPNSVSRPDVATVTAALDKQLSDKRLNEGDLFIFYFSGHGVGTPSGDYLLPTNATKANMEQVGLNVKDVVTRFVKAGLRNVLFIVDACRGGEKNTFGDDLRKLGKEANIAVFLSCEPGTRSYEYPQLGHGAFTNFLLKSLKSKDLQSSVSGALWASKVISKVSTDVKTYTERDYPNNPQTPTGWSEATMDVLLGAFPEKGPSKIKIADFEDEAKRLTPEGYADALLGYGSELFDQERYGDAVEVWRAGDALRKLKPGERMNLAFALNFIGRTFEADNELAKLEKSDPDNIYTWLSRIYNPSRKVTPQQRVEAAHKIWSLEKAEWTGYIVWAALRTYASQADTNDFLKDLLSQSTVAPRMKAYFEGFQLEAKLQRKEAIAKWESVSSIEGEYPTQESLDAAIYNALVMDSQHEALEPFLKKAAGSSKSASWSLLLAQLHKERHEDQAMQDSLQTALDKELTPADLLWAIRIAGLKFPLIAEKLAKRADEFPFSWKALLAKTWMTKLTAGQDALQESLMDAAKYCDDEFAVIFECLRFLDETLDQALEMGKTSKEQYAQLMLAYSEIMAENVDQFGYDVEAWILYDKFALLSEKFEQTMALYNIYLGPRLKDGTLDPSLRAPYLFAALAVGDRETAGRLWAMQGFHPSDTIDAGWILAEYEALYGSLDKAKTMIPKATPSETFRDASQAFLAYLKVRSGEKVDLDALQAKAEGHSAALHWVALAWVAKGDWAKAEPLLLKIAFEREIGTMFVQAKSLETLFNHLLEKKDYEATNMLALNTMISGYGNPIYKTIHFGKEATVPAFAGKIALDAAEFVMPADMEQGNLTLTIAKDGTVSGKSQMGERQRDISGKVDANGNLVATLKDGEKTWRMTGKIAQPSLYTSSELFKQKPQIFLLLDPKGQCRFLLGQPPR